MHDVISFELRPKTESMNGRGKEFVLWFLREHSPESTNHTIAGVLLVCG
jgi:hypothetical protein